MLVVGNIYDDYTWNYVLILPNYALLLQHGTTLEETVLPTYVLLLQHGTMFYTRRTC